MHNNPNKFIELFGASPVGGTVVVRTNRDADRYEKLTGIRPVSIQQVYKFSDTQVSDHYNKAGIDCEISLAEQNQWWSNPSQGNRGGTGKVPGLNIAARVETRGGDISSWVLEEIVKKSD
jgi:hypothetical protein